MILKALVICAMLSGIAILFDMVRKETRGMLFVRRKGYRTWGNSYLACLWIWVIFLGVCYGALQIGLWIIYHD